MNKKESIDLDIRLFLNGESVDAGMMEMAQILWSILEYLEGVDNDLQGYKARQAQRDGEF